MKRWRDRLMRHDDAPGAQDLTDRMQYASDDAHELLLKARLTLKQYYHLLADGDRARLDLYAEQLERIRNGMAEIAVQQQPQEPPF
jgi:hypothetical protein